MDAVCRPDSWRLCSYGFFLPLNGSLLPIFSHIREAEEKENFVIAGSLLGLSAWPLGVLSVDKGCQKLAAAVQGRNNVFPVTSCP